MFFYAIIFGLKNSLALVQGHRSRACARTRAFVKTLLLLLDGEGDGVEKAFSFSTLQDLFQLTTFHSLSRYDVSGIRSRRGFSTSSAETGKTKTLARRAIPIVLLSLTGGLGLSALDDLLIYHQCSRFSAAVAAIKGMGKCLPTHGPCLHIGIINLLSVMLVGFVITCVRACMLKLYSAHASNGYFKLENGNFINNTNLGTLNEPSGVDFNGATSAEQCSSATLTLLSFLVFSKAIEKAGQHQSILDAIGEPILRGPWYNASLAVADKRNSVSCTFPVTGPQGTGIFQLKAIRRGVDDTWFPYLRHRDWDILIMEALLHVPANEEHSQTFRIRLTDSFPPAPTGCLDCTKRQESGSSEKESN
ncbi:hypothetical protein ACLOJK_011067 [Asimina triloba]